MDCVKPLRNTPVLPPTIQHSVVSNATILTVQRFLSMQYSLSARQLDIDTTLY